MADGFVEYATKMADKQMVSDADLKMYRQLSFGRYEFDLDGKKIRLNSEGILGQPRAEDMAKATTNPRFWNLDESRIEAPAEVPSSVNHRDRQTPVKDQGLRATCVPFAALAQIEAVIKAKGGLEIDLSEQYANWLFMKLNARNQCNDIVLTTDAASILKTHGVCMEELFPYESKEDVELHCSAQPEAKAKENATFGIEDYDILFRLGHSGPSLSNPNYVETLLANDFDIVVGLEIAFVRPENGVFDVFLDKFRRAVSISDAVTGNPPGHAMLVVGYDKTVPQPFFILKNCWGADKGDGGYFKLSYEYFTTYAKVGYVISGVRTDMTANI